MLIDDILARPLSLLQEAGHARLGQVLRRAERFALAPGFTAAATVMAVENHDAHERLMRLLPLCRPPYPLTWIECAHADRIAAGWSKAGSDAGDPLVRPVKRVGVLIESAPGEDGIYVVTLFWSLADADLGWNSSSVAIIVDLGGAAGWVDDYLKHLHHAPLPADLIVSDATLARLYPAWQRNRNQVAAMPEAERTRDAVLARRAGVPMPNRFLDMAPFFATREGIGLVQVMGAAAIGDWGGEVDFWMVVLAMLASKNLCELEPVTDFVNLNRKRARGGKAPLSDYRTCRIDRRVEARIKAAGHGDGVRLHFCRGHFKQRKTGLFWWNPHPRGRPELGVINKNYEVRT